LLEFKDEEGVKWRIEPRLNAEGNVQSLSLFHRNRYGRKGMHSQRVTGLGTRGGLADIIAYIAKHEIYEQSPEILPVELPDLT